MTELECPVAFRNAPHQPYECSALVAWLYAVQVNPMTNLPVDWHECALEVIGPLMIEGRMCRPEFAISHIKKTLACHAMPMPSVANFLILFKDGWFWLYIVTLIMACTKQHPYASWDVVSIVFAIAHSAQSTTRRSGHQALIVGTAIMTAGGRNLPNSYSIHTALTKKLCVLFVCRLRHPGTTRCYYSNARRNIASACTQGGDPHFRQLR